MCLCSWEREGGAPWEEVMEREGGLVVGELVILGEHKVLASYKAKTATEEGRDECK